MFRGDTVETTLEHVAVFTEQGSSASQMTAVKVVDVMIAKLPGCRGQAPDAALLKIPMSERLDIWTCLPRHKWPKFWSSMEDPVVLVERNLYGHPLA